MKRYVVIEIDDIIITTDVLNANFTCNLKECKGACCTMESQYGAPLTKEEINIMENYLNAVKKYLTNEKIEQIENKGFWEIKSDTIMTTSINNRDCVFVYYDGNIAKCAFEKAYFAGEIDFRKPISCHLFPIRISEFGGTVLHYEKYPECKCAVELGKKTKISVFNFCKESLERLYGKEWFEKVKNKIDEEK